MECLRPEHHVDTRRPFTDAFAFLAGNATTDTNQDARILIFPLPPAAEHRKHLVLGFLPNRTGIHQQQISVFRLFCQSVAVRLTQDIRHLVRVVLVHLAAEGFDVELSFHGRWYRGLRQA